MGVLSLGNFLRGIGMSEKSREPRKGTCSVCKSPATYYEYFGGIHNCISDYAKLKAKADRLAEKVNEFTDCHCLPHGDQGPIKCNGCKLKKALADYRSEGE